ncbi:MAG: DUF2172 domain-containing protein [Thaumarchaeota archaeon]|nr:DUF2172 domain-containing protein [Nitrososphaerota archaeon]
MSKLIEDLWKKQRNLVSDDYEESLHYISKIIPLKIHEIPSGKKCWTWVIPEKWTANEAWIKDLDGNKLLDFKEHPLHLISYSLPIDKIVSKEELMNHLHSNPKRPNAIPFEFKYYQKDWGFCIQHNKLENFNKEKSSAKFNRCTGSPSLKVLSERRRSPESLKLMHRKDGTLDEYFPVATPRNLFSTQKW